MFAYGSLLWNPAFDHVEARRVLVPGWRRSFCLNMTNWRATPEQPGLMLALAHGGSCVGMAYRMPGDSAHERMLRLLKREVAHHIDIPWLRWLKVSDGQKVFRALTFYCAPRGSPDLVHLPIGDQAARLARAVGHKGSNAEYLLNTCTHLETLGIHDSCLWALQKLVAEEIDAHHPRS